MLSLSKHLPKNGSKILYQQIQPHFSASWTPKPQSSIFDLTAFTQRYWQDHAQQEATRRAEVEEANKREFQALKEQQEALNAKLSRMTPAEREEFNLNFAREADAQLVNHERLLKLGLVGVY